RRGFILSSIARGITEHLILRLDDLQLAAALILFDFAVECDEFAGLEFILQIRAVKPQAAEPRASLPYSELEDRHFAGTKQTRIADFADDRGHLAGPQFGNTARIQPVFIAEGQIKEQFSNGCNAFRGKNFRELWANSFYVLYRRGEFEHLSS